MAATPFLLLLLLPVAAAVEAPSSPQAVP